MLIVQFLASLPWRKRLLEVVYAEAIMGSSKSRAFNQEKCAHLLALRYSNNAEDDGKIKRYGQVF
jgi:hypothetical protein